MTTGYSSDDLLSIATSRGTVGDFLKRFTGEDSVPTDLDHYLPSAINFTLDRSLAAGEIGEDALDGHVAFVLSKKNDSTTFVSYIVVTDLSGNITRFEPMYDYSTSTKYLGLALKLKNTSTIMMGVAESGLTGPRAFFEYADTAKSFELFAEDTTGDSHDVQWSSSGDTFWQPILVQYEGNTGSLINDVSVNTSLIMDVNHCQLIDDDTVAIISSRGTNAILEVNMTTGDTSYVLGGRYGTVDIYDSDGTLYTKGSRDLWSGQHNAEYFGMNEYFLFDNQADSGNNSHLMVVEYDRKGGDGSTASVTFKYTLDGHSPVFGDCDMCPSGNILGCYWPEYVYPADGVGPTYDAQVLEVTRDGDSSEVAWEMTVTGESCSDKGGCDRTENGWSIYSAERFYDAPLVWNFTCSNVDDVLDASFSTVNTFKSMSTQPGSWSLVTRKSSEHVASGDFSFEPHWRSTTVPIELDVDAKDHALTLTVTNRWGETVSKDVDCDSS